MPTAEVVLRIMVCAAIAGAVRGQGLQGQDLQQKPRILTLQDAQSRAAAAGKIAELANLGVKAARYHRLGVQADYFPKIDAQFANLHFNKFMGQRIVLANRTVGLPLLNKDESFFAVTAIQPVTPVLQVRQAVRLARADERIAQAKADAAAAALKANVQAAYFALLIAQRRQVAAEAAAQTLAKLPAPSVRLASTAAARGTATVEVEKANSRVKELTEVLSALIGEPMDAVYDLAPPPPIDEADDNGALPALAIERNPEVVEARENVEKARAATNLAKLNYMPEVVGIWGYSNQTAIPLLPNDFSFVGFMATWNVFDFGKRERLVSERSTQLRMAQLNLDLVRAKVATGATKATSDIQRTRRVLQLTRRFVSMAPFDDSPDALAARAQAEAEMYQAELEFRQALQQNP